MEKLNASYSQTALLVTGTVQISRQMIAYVNGEIDEKELVTGIAETTACLGAAYIGKCVGMAIGNMIVPGVGGMIGQYVGEMITTAICSQVISTIRYSKEVDKQNRKIISLYRRAEAEIRVSQDRLEYIIEKENNELLYTLEEGFAEIIQGIQMNSYKQMEDGIAVIGSRFGLTREELLRDNVTRKNIFSQADGILELE